MLNERMKQVFAPSEAGQFGEDGLSKLLRVRRSVVRQPGEFRVAPDPFIGVKVGSICWKLGSSNPRVLSEVLANRERSIMDVTPIPDYRQRLLDLPVEMSQELYDVLSVNVLVGGKKLEIEAQAPPLRADSYGTNR